MYLKSKYRRPTERRWAESPADVPIGRALASTTCETFPVQTPPALPISEKPRRAKDWWGRNWAWFVPVAMVACLLSAGGMVVSILAVMRSSDAYQGAVARVRAAPAVGEAIGTPIEQGLFMMGRIHVQGAAGKAELQIPISGPKGKATVFVQATKKEGRWHFDRMIVQVAQGGRIDLSEK